MSLKAATQEMRSLTKFGKFMRFVKYGKIQTLVGSQIGLYSLMNLLFK